MGFSENNNIYALILVGGLGKNLGFVDSLKKILDRDVIVPKDPQHVSAIGAAISE